MKKILAAALAAIVMATALTGCSNNSENNPGDNKSNQSSAATDNSQPTSDNSTNANTSEDETSGDDTSGEDPSDDDPSDNPDTDLGTGIANYLEDVISAYLENVKTNPDLALYPMQQASAEGAVSGKTADGYLYVIVHENGEQIAKVLDDPSVELDAPDPDVDNSGIIYPNNKAGELAQRVLGTAWVPMEAVDDQDTIDIMFSEDFDLDLCEECFFATNTMSTHLQKIIIIKPKAGDLAE